jgi:hypothetical protein
MHNMTVEDEWFMVDPNERFDYGGDNVEPAHGQPTRTLDEFIDAHRRSETRKHICSWKKTSSNTSEIIIQIYTHTLSESYL